MAVTEEARHRLYQRLEEVLGEEATTLMELVPPVGWADVATKHDLVALGDAMDARLGGRIAAVEARMDGLELRMGGLEGRMDRLEGRMDRLDGRMDRFDGRMDRFEERMSTGFDQIHRHMRLQLYWLLGFFVSALGIVVGFVQLG